MKKTMKTITMLLLVAAMSAGIASCGKSDNATTDDNNQVTDAAKKDGEKDKKTSDDVEKPWEEDGAKPASEYNMEEFGELSDEQKEEFFESFETVDEFEAWLESIDEEQKEKTE